MIATLRQAAESRFVFFACWAVVALAFAGVLAAVIWAVVSYFTYSPSYSG